MNNFGKAVTNLNTERLKAASMSVELFDPALYLYAVRIASALNVGDDGRTHI
jgi:hypothetical protein